MEAIGQGNVPSLILPRMTGLTAELWEVNGLAQEDPFLAGMTRFTSGRCPLLLLNPDSLCRLCPILLRARSGPALIPLTSQELLRPCAQGACSSQDGILEPSSGASCALDSTIAYMMALLTGLPGSGLGRRRSTSTFPGRTRSEHCSATMHTQLFSSRLPLS